MEALEILLITSVKKLLNASIHLSVVILFLFMVPLHLVYLDTVNHITVLQLDNVFMVRSALQTIRMENVFFEIIYMWLKVPQFSY